MIDNITYTRHLARRVVIALSLIGSAALISGAPLIVSAHAEEVLAADKRAPIPSASLKRWRGAPFNMSALKGKVGVLVFWATWCEPCKQEIAHLLKQKSKHPELELLLISTDNSQTSSSIGRYARGWKSAKVLLDPDGSYLGMFSAQGNIPYTVITDKAGRAALHHNGYSAGDEEALLSAVKKLSAER